MGKIGGHGRLGLVPRPPLFVMSKLTSAECALGIAKLCTSEPGTPLTSHPQLIGCMCAQVDLEYFTMSATGVMRIKRGVQVCVGGTRGQHYHMRFLSV